MRAPAPPNVVGYLLDEARAVLADAGWHDVETAETQPPRRGLTGPMRVLRQRRAGGTLSLVVSGERAGGSDAGGPGRAPEGDAGRAAGTEPLEAKGT